MFDESTLSFLILKVFFLYFFPLNYELPANVKCGNLKKWFRFILVVVHSLINISASLHSDSSIRAVFLCRLRCLFVVMPLVPTLPIPTDESFSRRKHHWKILSTEEIKKTDVIRIINKFKSRHVMTIEFKSHSGVIIQYVNFFITLLSSFLRERKNHFIPVIKVVLLYVI